MSSEFKIGTANTIYDFLPLDTLLNTSEGVDPDWSFQPFSTSVRLANGLLRGNGFPIAVWRWNGISLEHRQILRDLIGTDLSAAMYIRTATNEIDIYDALVYKAYACIMNWPETDEDIQADNTLGLVLTFTHLVEVVE